METLRTMLKRKGSRVVKFGEQIIGCGVFIKVNSTLRLQFSLGKRQTNVHVYLHFTVRLPGYEEQIRIKKEWTRASQE